MTTMEPWISHNNPAKQLWLALSIGVVGLVLIVSFRDFAATDVNRVGGLLLGILFLAIGMALFLINGKQTTTIDPNLRLITIQTSNKFKTTRRVIAFSDIVDIKIGYQGTRSNFTTFYFLILKLRSGEEYSLFAPGQFYAGTNTRESVEQMRQQLKEYMVRRTS